MRRGAIPNDGALPYLTLLMELGTESTHRETGSKLKFTTPKSSSNDGQFQELVKRWMSAVTQLADYRKKGGTSKTLIKRWREDIEEKRLVMDSCNRYSISVRGACPDTYGILKEADIVDEFATLLCITTPSSTSQDSALQHMRPFEHLGETSPHMTWMSKYVVNDSEDDEQ
jgi:hypothetical protein